MSSRGRSETPSRRYGEIIGSIFSNGSGELEETKKASVSLVKQKFRERRQKNSRGSSLDRISTDDDHDEQRQNPSSPTREYNEARTRSSNRAPTPDRTKSRSSSRPPTPDRKKSLFDSPSDGRPPTPDRNRRSIFDSPSEHSPRNNALSGSRLEPFQSKTKGISIRPLSVSPTKRRVFGVNPSDSSGSLTNRVRQQVSKNMNTTQEVAQKAVATIFLEKPAKFKSSQMKTVKNEETAKAEQHSEFIQKTRITEGSSPKMDPNSGVSTLFSTGDVSEMKEIIVAQNEQINFFETCLKKRSNDIEQLTLELKLSRKNESRLDLELEMHDLKYSMYDDYRRMMDRQRLASTSNTEEFEKGGIKTSFFTNSNVAFVKLDQLDRLYEKSKLEAESHFSILRKEYNRIVSTISISGEDESRGYNIDASSDRIATPTDLLENRIKILEAENLRYSLNLKKKEEELKMATSILKDSSSSRKEENRFYTHDLEKRALKNKIIALETEIGFTSGLVDDKTRTRRYKTLEKNLDDYVTEIMGLEDRLKEKEKIISKLKERDIEMNLGSDKRNHLDSDWLMPTGKWYKQSNNRQKGQTAFRGKEMITSKSFDSDNIAAASTVTTENITCTSDSVGRYKMGIKKSVGGRRVSESSARIAKLRKRLDALASDYCSVGTEETQRSSKTSPS